MFKKILVCLDGSKLAEAALPYAIEEAKRFESELVLFRAYYEPLPTSPAVPGAVGVPVMTKRVAAHLVEDEKEVERYLKSLAGKLQKETKLAVSYDKAMGQAGPAIVEYCGKQGVELIAIASHGRSGLGRVVLGSVADYVTRHSSVPILLVRPAA